MYGDSQYDNDPNVLGFDAGLGAAEQRTEPYMEYGEGAAQAETMLSAKSTGRVSSSARKQASVAQGVTVHDGFPNPATDTSLQTLDLNKLLVRHGASTYFMRIEGNLWNDVGIFDNDIALIDRSLRPRPNDLVIWISGEELVVSAKHRVPMDTPIWGIVTTIIHQFRNSTPHQPAHQQS
jgi:hypothetical protein